MLLSIIIPAYNEEKRISEMLLEYGEFFADREVEFIVVLNGCQDNTVGVVREFVDRHPDRVRYLDFPERIGKGGAVLEGFRVAKGDIISFVDADGSTSPEEFQKLLKGLINNDAAIASRWKTGSEVVNRNFLRNLASYGFRAVVKVFFRMPFIDTQCGAKAFKKELISKILPSMKITNMAFDVELLYRSLKAGYKIIEIPTRWIDKSSSALLGSPGSFLINGLKMFYTLIQIRFLSR